MTLTLSREGHAKIEVVFGLEVRRARKWFQLQAGVGPATPGFYSSILQPWATHSSNFMGPRSGHSLLKTGQFWSLFLGRFKLITSSRIIYDARILKGCQQSHPAQFAFLFHPILVNVHFGSSSMATARGRGGGFGRRRSGRHARAAAAPAGCRLGRRRSHRRPRTSAAPSTSSPMIGRQFEVSALSGGSVGRLCGSGGRVW